MIWKIRFTLLEAPLKCSELGCSVLDVILPFKQLKLWTWSYATISWLDILMDMRSNCLPFGITIMLLLCFFLGSHTWSLIMKSDCCGFCQMTKKQGCNNSNKTLFCVGMFPKSTAPQKANPKHLSSETHIVLRKWSSRWQIFYFSKT